MLAKLRDISEYLVEENKLENSLEYIAKNICPTGEPARLVLFRISGSESLFAIHDLGFNNPYYFDNYVQDFFQRTILAGNLDSREPKLSLNDRNYQRTFKKQVGRFDDELFKSTVLVPLLPGFILVISLRSSDIGGSSQVNFQIFGSILNLYIRSLSEKSLRLPPERRALKDSLLGTKLSERQELILEMMIEGLTNNAIANKIGYSESLIRQETIAIYKKLGVNGRTDLRK